MILILYIALKIHKNYKKKGQHIMTILTRKNLQIRKSIAVNERKQEIYALLEKEGIIPSEITKDVIENYVYIPKTIIREKDGNIVIETTFLQYYDRYIIRKDGTVSGYYADEYTY